jgi:hypothetical protein
LLFSPDLKYDQVLDSDKLRILTRGLHYNSKTITGNLCIFSQEDSVKTESNDMMEKLVSIPALKAKLEHKLSYHFDDLTKKNAIIKLLCKYYEPDFEKVKHLYSTLPKQNLLLNEREERKRIREALLEKYIITGVPTDFVPTQYITESFNVDAKTLKPILESLGARYLSQKKFKFVGEDKSRNVGGYTRIKLRSEAMEVEH